MGTLFYCYIRAACSLNNVNKVNNVGPKRFLTHFSCVHIHMCTRLYLLTSVTYCGVSALEKDTLWKGYKNEEPTDRKI